MAKKNRSYCENCKFRISTVGINEKGFCEIGYRQNPISEKATYNAMANGAVLCSRNRFANSSFKERKWSMAELLLEHPNSLNESLSKFKYIDSNLSLYLK